MEFTCESCGHNISVSESAVGKRAKCPKCNKINNILSPIAMIEEVPVTSVGETRCADEAIGLSLSEFTKACPFCGELILEAAKKCKHCGEFFDQNFGVVVEQRKILNHKDTQVSKIANAGSAYCPSCSNVVSSKAEICPACGIRLNQGGDASTGLLVAGWLGVFFFPILGLVIGIICCCRRRPGHGIFMILLSLFWIVFSIVWAIQNG